MDIILQAGEESDVRVDQEVELQKLIVKIWDLQI